MRSTAVLLLTLWLAGCGGKGSLTTPASAPGQKLPIEVTGNPEDALPKQPARPKR